MVLVAGMAGAVKMDGDKSRQESHAELHARAQAAAARLHQAATAKGALFFSPVEWV